MPTKLLQCVTLLALLLSGTAFAEDIEIIGDIKQTIKTPLNRAQAMSQTPANHSISLLRLSLSSHAKEAITARIEKVQNTSEAHISSPNYPSQIQLGMNGVPVLDQGSFGTCVTFATTAVIDAIYGKGDYISQLCQLELGSYLERNTYTSSGWNGSWGRIVLSQMDVFGIVPKSYQTTSGCADLYEYPNLGEKPLNELSVTDYHQISQPLAPDQVAWSSLIEAYQVSSDQVDLDKLLLEVKRALIAGDRLTFGLLLLDFDQGVVGAVGTSHEKFDTWVLSPEIARDINEQTEFAGHEMIITGYDDNAIARDPQGRIYRGLLTLRNSWGGKVGDKGNFYMSYDYFKALILEVYRIRHLS